MGHLQPEDHDPQVNNSMFNVMAVLHEAQADHLDRAGAGMSGAGRFRAEGPARGSEPGL